MGGDHTLSGSPQFAKGFWGWPPVPRKTVWS
jgi:hypothetical protein